MIKSISTIPLLYIVNGPTGKVIVDSAPNDRIPLTANGAKVAENLAMSKARLNTFSVPDQAVLTLGVRLGLLSAL